jgi:uncharacterized membrane protein YqjE
MGDPVRTAMGNLGQYGASGRERSIAELVRDVIADVQSIMRSEVLLARVETREEIGKAAAASKLLMAAAVVGLFAAAFALVTVFQALCLVLPGWLSALIVCILLGIIAGGMASAGIARWKTFHAVPPKTAETVKENVEWARNQTKS